MGSWNGTCAVSNLHVRSGQDVAVFILLKNNEEKTFCYNNALYDVCPIPFYGKYNDYGGVKDCHGFGLNIVVEELRKQLYEFGEGPNSYHDVEVRKKDFNIDMLFDADGEDRLAVQNRRKWSTDEYNLVEMKRLHERKELTSSQQFELDRLANKIKNVDAHRRATHVVIHGDVFRSILNDWYIEEYVGPNLGNTGYNKSYIHVYFEDIINTLPEYISRYKDHYKKIKELSKDDKVENISKLYSLLREEIFSWDDPCLAGRWMEYFRQDSSKTFDLINVRSYQDEYHDAENWEDLELFTKEALTGAWVNSFMVNTRKIWTKQTGEGSQSDNHIGYTTLANSVLKIINKEQEDS